MILFYGFWIFGKLCFWGFLTKFRFLEILKNSKKNQNSKKSIKNNKIKNSLKIRQKWISNSQNSK